MITFVFQNDSHLLNFNLSWMADETLQSGNGPRESDLYVLVQKARKGVKDAAEEYADAMYWTLRPPAFESFQRTFGARAIEFRDWFYSKLFQFFMILVHDKVEVLGNGPLGYFGPPRSEKPWEEGEILRGLGGAINPDDLEAAFSVGDHRWEEFVQLAVASGDGAFDRVRAAVLKRARERSESKAVSGGKTWQWTDNVKRDQIIVEGLEAGRSRPEICQILDQHLIPTTPYLRNRGYTSWGAAWGDKESRRRVQSLFSKVPKRKAVNR